ncbi:hypothetical protein MPNT_10403 [Candidatus Methylacidithermus pantelleriae]|uniref:Uncharacterized protein n=1 Tax=Candidatus Methylacidithermus pantelleriae TaxID=2744239 RepID=A0A8J2BJS2_9BACT|nr:hypothetical protein MPNT_10403 [Candidatus Methylacidithermus pantelleriae]
MESFLKGSEVPGLSFGGGGDATGFGETSWSRLDADGKSVGVFFEELCPISIPFGLCSSARFFSLRACWQSSL